MPVGFVGLSYEVQQLSDPAFFSAQNSGLIREFKALSSTGVLRLGGNTSEFAYWKPSLTLPNQSILRSVRSRASRRLGTTR